MAQAATPPQSGATIWIAVSAAVNGLAVFALQVVGTRALGPVAYAPIGVLWTLQYLWIAVLVTAVEAYVIRSSTVQGPQGAHLKRFIRRFARWLLAAGAGAATLGWVFRASLFDDLGDLALVLGLVVVAYGWYGVLRGRAAGMLEFRTYAFATAGESVLRLMAALIVLGVVASTRSLAWVFPLGPIAVVVALWPRLRRLAETAAPSALVRGDAEVVHGGGTRFLLATSTANAAVQFLLAGGPLVLLPLGADAAAVSVFFTTITAARVPMTFALNGGLSRFLPRLTQLALVDDTAGLRRASRQLAASAVVFALFAAAVAAAIGPQLIALVFGADFRPSRTFAALVGLGTVLAVGGLFLAQVYIATGREARLPVTWLAALALAGALVLALPGPPDLRVAGAFTIATTVAVVWLSLPLVRRDPHHS